jgi:hypothetical protein
MATNSVRCKVRCDFNNMDPDRQDIAATVSFTPVYDADPKSENGKFFAATPSGTISLNVVNPDAAASFEQGSYYFLDFTPAPEPKGEVVPKVKADPKPEPEPTANTDTTSANTAS